ncbi:MAG: AAA family ATPase [Frankiaceae bacterium]|nr:AAA family ATPase [Frankiaceae bacterium]MBV9369179.1 AAA family ATPase [Frankiales bacterium]
MLTAIAVDHYRSLRRLRLPLGQITVVTGANGTGKSNVYRTLRLLSECARDGVVAPLAREGGLASSIWAGRQQGKSRPVELRLGFGCDDFSYAIDLGLPVPDETSMFNRDPQIKIEAIWAGPVLRPATSLVERRGPTVRVKDRDSRGWALIHDRLRSYDSVLNEIADYERAPEVIHVREYMRGWRFYDHFRTDPSAPARLDAVGTRTPVLDSDGSSLAAAWRTIVEVGDAAGLHETLTSAFPGSRIDINDVGGRFELAMHQRGLNRALTAAELSDGTLRFLLLAAALLSPRPASLLVLNEPETSLHPALLPALGQLIARAAKSTQLFVVSHSQPLIQYVEQASSHNLRLIELTRDDEGTKIVGLEPLEEPAWHFPER